MISPFTVLQYAVSFTFLSYASYRDIKCGEVRNMVWLAYAVPSIVLATVNFTLCMQHAIFLYILNVALTFLLVTALWQLGVVGGADVKALTVISLAHTSSLLAFANAGVMLLTANFAQKNKNKKHLPAIPFITLGLAFAFIQVLLI